MAKYILILLIFASCGKRITSKQHYEFESDTLSVENTVKIEQNTTWNDIIVLKPFDVLKPIKINGKEYHNVIVTIDKSKNTENKKEEIKKENKGSKNESDKNSNTESSNDNFLWIGIVAAIAFFIFLYFKTKNPLK
jgi:LPXTG-motif cell wall-anchored protein